MTAAAPLPTAAGTKSSPLNTLPRNAPKTLPGATLRWSIAKPVTCESLSIPARSPRRTGLVLRFFVNVGKHLCHVRLALLVWAHAQHRRDPADSSRDYRRDVPAGSPEPECFSGGLGLVEHDDDHIAGFVHRENAREAGHHQRSVVIFFRAAGLAADAIARSIGFPAGALGHHQAKQRAHLVTGLLAEHPMTPGRGAVTVNLQKR